MAASADRQAFLHALGAQPFVFFATDSHAVWRYAWPFLSARQCLVALALSLAAALFCIAVLPESLSADERMAVFVLFEWMLIYMLQQQLPGKITIAATRGQAQQLVPLLTQMFLALGLSRIALPSADDRARFRPDCDAWWCRVGAPEQEIALAVADANIIEVTGPKHALRTLGWKLRWKRDDAAHP